MAMQDFNMLLGAWVVRGIDWSWGDQDGSVGFVGTVVKPDSGGNDIIYDGTVFVQWDMGRLANYRVGRNNAFDLRLFETAAAGES